MAVGVSTYIVKLSEGDKQEMLVRLRDNETLRANLTRMIPKAIEQGYLSKDCSANHVRIDHQDRVLNLDLPLDEQEVREHDVLVLRNMACEIRMDIRYKPDKSGAVEESVTVDPTAVLREALGDFADKLRGKYRFHGRRLKKYHILHGKKKLNLKKSLRSQDIDRDLDVVFRPRVWFEWPPGLIWPPGPFTTYTIGAVVLLLLVGYAILNAYAGSKQYMATIVSTRTCKIVDPPAEVLREDEVFAIPLSVGDHTITIYPKRYPIQEKTVTVKKNLIPWRKSVEFSIDPAEAYGDATPIEITFDGRYETPPWALGRTPRINRIEGHELVINRFVYENVDGGPTIQTRLHRGPYEIKYDGIPEEQFVGASKDRDMTQLTIDDFIFDFADTIWDGGTSFSLKLYYSEHGEQ